MFDLIDSEETIVLAKMSKLLTKYSSRVILENGDGKSLLECSGLSLLVEEYNEYLTPHSFNGSWKNPNTTFNPGFAINEICDKIKSNKKALGMFLNEFLSRIREIDNADIDSTTNYLSVLGYNLEVTDRDGNYSNSYQYSLSPYTEGAFERREDVSYLVNMINQKHSELMTYYTEAISTYGNTEYQGCIGNCRTLFEKFFEKLDAIDNNHTKGILNATEETVTGSNIPKFSIKGIFTYWIEHKKGFNRYRLFVSMYSLLSALGPHGEEIPSKEDALMCLRLTEDALIWCFQNNIGR
ncbi:hypothetical protein K2F40_15105 [Clostridium sp. CM028]|uniref:hypothetical protein n=1 Tax=Clostridium sp. CM028 TaxID=2851575 RepID=UPI001C6E669F|nr:hypothetical protein [Clostridium sp. CM028]MBW9150287.1 hypothetical protein [Clostridium sp. CM028]WLC62837.1 hypothetical protein KTC94_06170 [Clostridium sp. CM028]